MADPLSQEQLAVLERFRPELRADGSEMRLRKTVVDSVGSKAVAEQLVEMKMLVRHRQGRRAFPPLYEITDAGVSELPPEAPPRQVAKQALLGHSTSFGPGPATRPPLPDPPEEGR